MKMGIFGSDEKMEKEEGFEEPKGINDAYAVNLKRLVARELDMDRDLQGKEGRIIEDTIEFRKALDTQYLSDIAGIRAMEKQMLGDHFVIKGRKEHKAEERAEELEETFNEQITAANQAAAGTNAQMASSNAASIEVIGAAVSGAIQELIAKGILKAA
jgi:hypothetical protein